jgi:hypothetical protein
MIAKICPQLEFYISALTFCLSRGVTESARRNDLAIVVLRSAVSWYQSFVETRDVSQFGMILSSLVMWKSSIYGKLSADTFLFLIEYTLSRVSVFDFDFGEVFAAFCLFFEHPLPDDSQLPELLLRSLGKAIESRVESCITFVLQVTSGLVTRISSRLTLDHEMILTTPLPSFADIIEWSLSMLGLCCPMLDRDSLSTLPSVVTSLAQAVFE